MSIRYPAPLRPGDRIAITSPSSGVGREMRPRLDFCVKHLRDLAYDVVLGDCMDGSGVTSAPAPDRAAELTAMLLDPTIRAVVPPWGGELAIDLLPLLDFDAISAAEPTWLVGYDANPGKLVMIAASGCWANTSPSVTGGVTAAHPSVIYR